MNVLSHLAFCFDYGIICLMFHADSGVGFNDCKFHMFMLQTISKRAHHFMFLFKSTSQSFCLSCTSTVFCFEFSWQCSGSPWWLKGSSFFWFRPIYELNAKAHFFWAYGPLRRHRILVCWVIVFLGNISIVAFRRFPKVSSPLTSWFPLTVPGLYVVPTTPRTQRSMWRKPAVQ